MLDVGCGNGIPVMRAIQERHRGVGVDISGVQIDLARENVPGGRFIRGGIMEVDFLPEFDAIVAFYSVEHVPRGQHAELFSRLLSWLKPGGRLMFTLEPYDEPDRTDEWLGVPMFFSAFDPDTTSQLLADDGDRSTHREPARGGAGDRVHVVDSHEGWPLGQN